MTHLVSVVIPVKNGREFLGEVLSQVLLQKTDFSYEVVVIDSGSTDGSLDIIRSYGEATLIQIPPGTFNHGLTRNFGVEKSSGEFIAFITQDATPVNDDWLQNLVAPMIENPEVAGVFGKHLARPDCDPIVALNLDDHFDRSISRSRAFWRKDENYEAEKNLYVFFSNNNSCIRRKVWEEIPFRKVEMSEDQWWAQDILHHGYVKCYEPTALVYHSHNYTPVEWFQRQFDEYRAYSKLGLVQTSSFPSALKSILNLSVSDVKRINQVADLSSFKKAYWSVRRPLTNLGVVAGQFLGARHDRRFVEAIQNFLSQQVQKINAK
jgi:glycosyltransferase involved in cell wall biosynthesis